MRAADVVDRGHRRHGARASRRRPGRCDLTVPLLGRGKLLNVLAATAVGARVRRAARRPSSSGAASLHAGGASRRACCGCRAASRSSTTRYNASPAAPGARSTRCARRAPQRAAIAVLGEMLELGDARDALHAECGRGAARAGLDVLVAVGGPPARAMADAAVAAGMPAASVASHVASEAGGRRRRAARSRAGDVVLVKGSRGTRTDMVADRLKAEWA